MQTIGICLQFYTNNNCQLSLTAMLPGPSIPILSQVNFLYFFLILVSAIWKSDAVEHYTVVIFGSVKYIFPCFVYAMWQGYLGFLRRLSFLWTWQTFLVWQLVFSVIILDRRYSINQILGCLLVALGVIVAVARYGFDAYNFF